MTPNRPDLCENTRRTTHRDVLAETVIIWPSNGRRVRVCYPCGARLVARFLGYPPDRGAWAASKAREFAETLAKTRR